MNSDKDAKVWFIRTHLAANRIVSTLIKVFSGLMNSTKDGKNCW